MHSATAARMALAGIEPATRWISPSRSTGELQEPSLWRRSRRDSNPHPPERQSGALPLRNGFRKWHDERMTPPSGSRVSHENAIRASATAHATSHITSISCQRASRSLFPLPAVPVPGNKKPHPACSAQVGRTSRPMESSPGRLWPPVHAPPLHRINSTTATALDEGSPVRIHVPLHRRERDRAHLCPMQAAESCWDGPA